MDEKTIAALSSPMSDLSIEILRSGAEVAAAFTGLSALRADVDWATEKPSRRRRAHLRQLASEANRAGFGELSSPIAHAHTHFARLVLRAPSGSVCQRHEPDGGAHQCDGVALRAGHSPCPAVDLPAPPVPSPAPSVRRASVCCAGSPTRRTSWYRCRAATTPLATTSRGCGPRRAGRRGMSADTQSAGSLLHPPLSRWSLLSRRSQKPIAVHVLPVLLSDTGEGIGEATQQLLSARIGDRGLHRPPPSAARRARRSSRFAPASAPTIQGVQRIAHCPTVARLSPT